MKRVYPHLVRDEVNAARRARRIAHLEVRRPNSLRLAILKQNDLMNRAWDNLRKAMAPAIAALRECGPLVPDDLDDFDEDEDTAPTDTPKESPHE